MYHKVCEHFSYIQLSNSRDGISRSVLPGTELTVTTDIEDERKRESPLDIHKSHILKYLPYEQKYDANSNRKMEDPL